MIEMKIFHFSAAGMKRDGGGGGGSHAVCLISAFSAFKFNAQFKRSQMLTGASVCFCEICADLSAGSAPHPTQPHPTSPCGNFPMFPLLCAEKEGIYA